jgi:AraC-like DNA-binding protein
VASKNLTEHSTVNIAPLAIDSLLNNLDVAFIALAQCFVSPGYVLKMGGLNATGIHYNLSGTGKMQVGKNTTVDLYPHTLIIVPPNFPYQISVTHADNPTTLLKAVNGSIQTNEIDTVRQFVAGNAEKAGISLICGYFIASYGSAINLFDGLTVPIIEQFEISDQVDHTLRSALIEFTEKRAGFGAMSAALLKQVMIVLLRRSFSSVNLLIERFSMLSDPRIARAFAVMVADPGGNHTVLSLAESASLSRSAFMARFTELLGRSPMAVLRELRMKKAALQLKTGTFSVNQIARNCGYKSRSSFTKAFRKAFDRDPSAYIATNP